MSPSTARRLDETAADGGFASRDNLARAKTLGVHDVAFGKAGLCVVDMVKSNWVYRKLRNFRAGIELDISRLKRAYGLARCLWRGLGGPAKRYKKLGCHMGRRNCFYSADRHRIAFVTPVTPRVIRASASALDRSHSRVT